jgi:hypothetical protein
VGDVIPEYASQNNDRRISRKKALEIWGRVPRKYHDIGDVAGAAWDNEFTNTPTRPFMSQSFDMNESKYAVMSDRYFEGTVPLGKVIEDIAIAGKEDMKNTIMSGNFAPNTSVEKFYKGHDKPLIWDGKMYNSITSTTCHDVGGTSE